MEIGPLSILHVGYFRMNARGAFIHSVSQKLSRGFVRAGHAVFNFSDRDVARAATVFRSRQLGVGAVNRVLVQLARDIRPDLLVLGHADTIRASTVATIRRENPALKVVQWNVDPLFENGNVVTLQSKLDVVDATLVSTAGDSLAPFKRKGMRLGFLPNPVDFSIESGKAHLNAAPRFDVFYACGNPRRPQRLVCGTPWNMDDFFSKFAGLAPELRFCLPGVYADGLPTVVGADYQDALQQCAIGLNVSKRNDLMLYSSDRLAHMIGNGLLVLMPRSTGYDRLFSSREMTFFSNFDELVEATRRLAADPSERMDIAAAGRARYHQLFNETRVAKYIIEVAFDTISPKSYEWPTLYA